MIISVLFRISWNFSVKNFALSIIWLPCKARKILHSFLLSVFRAIRWCPGDSGFLYIYIYIYIYYLLDEFQSVVIILFGIHVAFD